MHHIPEWLHFSKNINPFQSSIFLGFGVLVLMGFELLQEVIFSKHDGGETSFPVTILFGNFFHSLMDGILVVYSFQLSVEVGWLVCVGILMHELPKSISFISIFVYSGIGKIKSTFFVFISGMGILWGMSLGKVMSYLKIDHADNVFPISTGILLFLALSKIYPEVRSKTKGELLIPSLLFFFLGLGIVYTIRNFFSGGYE
ncbi:MAG: ZIP family metal transporter [Leptospira sp.]|nr:ZIP family metal transporter [Leptospira sp.]